MPLPTNESLVRAAAERPGQPQQYPNNDTGRRRFVARFGIDPALTTIVWNIIIFQDNFPAGAFIHHLLWSLCFLKTYEKENNIATYFGVNETTYRTYNWRMLACLARMPVINFADRFINAPLHVFTYMTVDGTDFKINEPTPFSGMWLSHKFNHAALRYEIGVSIFSGLIVWVKGPYPAGRYPDLMIVRLTDGLEANLGPLETYFADAGYEGSKRAVVGPMTSELRSRHETVNGMFKECECMRAQYRHALDKHQIIAASVINIVALRIQCQTPLYTNVDFNIGVYLPKP